jgi:hypothetical protein
MYKKLLYLWLCLFIFWFPAALAADRIKIGNFSQGDLSGWEEKIFTGKTIYSLVSDQGRTVLKAQSQKSASGLFKKVKIDPKKHPVLSWSWKIENTIKKGNARSREGDDYPARIYVVFPSLFFFGSKGVNYIWANRLPQGEAVKNPFTDNVMMIAVKSGNSLAGVWQKERRNLVRDFKALFGEDPPEIGAVAIMTDSDNTKDRATAFYGDIFFEKADRIKTKQGH